MRPGLHWPIEPRARIKWLAGQRINAPDGQALLLARVNQLGLSRVAVVTIRGQTLKRREGVAAVVDARSMIDFPRWCSPALHLAMFTQGARRQLLFPEPLPSGC